MKPLRINVITMGCAKNLVDSEVIMSRLQAAGFEVVHDSDQQSDVVIINTCGFINDAKQESIDTIIEWNEFRKKGHTKKVFVTGCLSQRYKEELEKEIPETDKYFHLLDIEGILKELGAKDNPSCQNPRKLTTLSHYSYLKIAEGCDHRCSFCAIPLIRGQNVSRPLYELVDEARWLASKGVKELNLIAQDLTWYGLDLYGERSLSLLLRCLSSVQGIDWIRLLYTHPAGFPQELMQQMARNPKICNYIDIPLQHINDELLKSMRRSHTGSQARKLLNDLRETVPGIAIRTSFIVGYPEESEEAFKELYDFVTEMRFDRMGVFVYSHEDGTPAASLNDAVPEKIKQERYDTLMQLQQTISLENNRKKIGKILTVLIDGKEGDFYTGRTQYDAPEVDTEVLISSDQALETGKFYNVIVAKADFYDLFASYPA